MFVRWRWRRLADLVPELSAAYTDQLLRTGGDLDSTRIAKPVVHAEVRGTS